MRKRAGCTEGAPTRNDGTYRLEHARSILGLEYGGKLLRDHVALATEGSGGHSGEEAAEEAGEWDARRQAHELGSSSSSAAYQHSLRHHERQEVEHGANDLLGRVRVLVQREHEGAEVGDR